MEHARPECVLPLRPAEGGRPADVEAERLFHDLQFEAQRCAFYHGMRARFFDTVGKAISLLSLVAGAGAFTTLLQDNKTLVAALASVTAFFSGLNLIVGFARKARDHEVLRGKYYGLMVDLDRARGDLAKLREAGWRMKGFFADGTIFMSALDMIAHNRTCLARDPNARVVEVPWWHERLAHVWSFTAYYARPNGTGADAADEDAEPSGEGRSGPSRSA